MTEQNKLIEELSRVPDLPQGLFESVQGTIRHKKTMRQVFVALAATLVLCAGISVTVFTSGYNNTLPAEVANELIFINDYSSGNDIMRDVENYALYDDDMSE